MPTSNTSNTLKEHGNYGNNLSSRYAEVPNIVDLKGMKNDGRSRTVFKDNDASAKMQLTKSGDKTSPPLHFSKELWLDEGELWNL
ncbi:hypothetical protein RB195_017811 [Necator americanus]|uniref:Uncharacterized protein n=1 Tax=Necator americanus TaxID=51031 RepID=A0ABR1C7W7_NECAM